MEAEILGKISREKLLSLLESQLSEKRTNHILGVERMAVRLAAKLGEDVVKCRTSALYHDFAKSYSLERSIGVMERYHVKIDGMERTSTDLLHSKVAAALAKNKYGIIDEDVLNAITFHTTGRVNMSAVEKIIFVADAIEESRMYDGVEDLRQMAFTDLDLALLEVLNRQIIYLIQKGKIIHPQTLEARNYLLNKEV